MRVIHAIPVYAPAWQYGGPVLSVSRLCEALVAEGIEVQVITTNAGLPDLDSIHPDMQVERNGVSVRYFPVDRQRGAINSRALQQGLPNAIKGADLLHLSAIWQPLGIPLQKAARREGIPVLHSLRGALSPYSFGQGWWKKIPYYLIHERQWLEQAAGLHVTSEQERRELRALGLRKPKYLLPNPLDLNSLYPKPQERVEWRNRLRINHDETVFLVCGRQHHKKGLDLLPSVLRMFADRPWRLLLVGSDDDGSGRTLKRDLFRMGLGARLLEISTISAQKLSGIYNASDLLLLPSRHENFGNVVMEALACGCAVAISDRTGVACDLLTNAPAGYGVVLPRHGPSWQRWLGTWLKEPHRATPAVTAWVTEHYSQTAVARAAIELYQRILQTRTQS